MPLAVHVAVVQYWAKPHDRVTNMDKALHMLDDAAHTADLILLPELSFGNCAPYPEAADFAEPIPGPITAVASEIAVSRNAHLCFGIAERDGETRYNSAVLIAADGTLIGRHRKIRLSEVDLGAGFSPGHDLQVLKTHLGRMGMLIGEDAQDMHNVRTLSSDGAELLALPSAAVAAPPAAVEQILDSWEILLKGIARHGRCHLLWANGVGGTSDHTALGNSMILNPNGRVIARAAMEEEILRARIVLERE